MKRIAVLTSGGDAPGMNACIRTIVKYGIGKGAEVFGIYRGYSGLLEGDIKELSVEEVWDINHQGGTILRSARCLEFKTQEGLSQAMNILKIFRINGLIVIGGDGSFRGVQALHNLGISTIGVPGTIDNDLAFTEYTIGFDTAVNTALEAISRLEDTTFSHERIALIQVMGRHCGDIALHAGLAGGADAVIIPEIPYDVGAIGSAILQARKNGKMQSVIVMAEGAGDYQAIAEALAKETKIEVRTTILGHIQRGGTPTAQDRLLASLCGVKAVDLLWEGKSGRVVGKGNSRVIDMDIHEALAMEKLVSEEMKALDKAMFL